MSYCQAVSLWKRNVGLQTVVFLWVLIKSNTQAQGLTKFFKELCLDNTAAFLTFIAMKQQLLVKTTILLLAELSTIITLVCDKIDWEDHTSPPWAF